MAGEELLHGGLFEITLLGEHPVQHPQQRIHIAQRASNRSLLVDARESNTEAFYVNACNVGIFPATARNGSPIAHVVIQIRNQILWQQTPTVWQDCGDSLIHRSRNLQQSGSADLKKTAIHRDQNGSFRKHREACVTQCFIGYSLGRCMDFTIVQIHRLHPRVRAVLEITVML